MKTCHILPQGKAPKLEDCLFVRITDAVFQEVYEQYYGYQGRLCLLVAPSVPEAALLKFVEDATGDLDVVIHHTPGLVFLSRFSKVMVGIKPVISQFPPKTSAQVILDECKKACAS